MKTTIVLVTTTLLLVGLLVSTTMNTQQRPREDQCFVCHDMLEDEATVAFRSDVHRSAGVSCADCHGGDRFEEDMDIAMSSAKGFIGIPRDIAISKACASCHDDEERMRNAGYTGPIGQLASLRHSAHAQGTHSGEELVLQCTSCHGAHGIRPVKDPRSPVSPLRVVSLCASCHSDPAFMRTYNPSLPTDQLAKYRTSVHGQRNLAGDPRVATCVDCHTAHDIKPANETTSSVNAFRLPATCGKCHSDAEYMKPYDIRTDQVSEFTTSVHGIALLEKGDSGSPSCNDCHGNHGAMPPEVTSISHVCGTCHSLNAELFRKSRHKVEFERLGKPECETCHGYHAVQPATEELLSLETNTACGSCHGHERAPVGYRAANIMRGLLDSLQITVALADERLHAAEQKGMEVDDIRYALRGAKQARLQSRTAIHAFDLDVFREVMDPGLLTARNALRDAEAANSEFFFRRYGLAVATLIITLNVILLILYIRRLERKDRAVA